MPSPDPAALPGGTAPESLSYEQARAALTEVVQRLEAGGTSLQDSLALWERGELLADRCQTWLDGARARLDAARAAGGQSAGPPGGDTDADG